MVESYSLRLDSVFSALADPTRRGMLASLALGEKSVGELGHPFDISFAGAAKHVKVLENAGLIHRRKAGRKQMCSLRAEPLKDATLWTEQFRQNWEARFSALDSLLDEMKSEERSRKRRS